jgi:hypothetical protein
VRVFYQCCLLLLIGIVWPGVLRAQKAGGNQRTQIPKFEDYPAPEWTGPPAPIKLTPSSERFFRTNLRAAAEEPPNFAGRYSFVSWGCGTNCMGGAVVDLQSGKVFQPSLAENRHGEAIGQSLVCSFLTILQFRLGQIVG